MAEFISDEDRAAHVAALVREHAGLLASGAKERAADVEAELKRLGHFVEEHAPAKTRRATARKAVADAAEAAEVRNDASS